MSRCPSCRAPLADQSADAFAVYREVATSALGIPPSSCADDVREAVEALRAERDELRPGIIADVLAEMASGEAKHGPLGTYDGEPIPDVQRDMVTWGAANLEAYSRTALRQRETASVLAILGEEVGEMARAKNDAERRDELVQIAAVAIRWIAMIDARREKEPTP